MAVAGCSSSGAARRPTCASADDGTARPTACPARATWLHRPVERAVIFIKRVGGIILALTVLLWFLASFPAPPEGATGAAIQYSWPACWATRWRWCWRRSASTGRSPSPWCPAWRRARCRGRAGHGLRAVGHRRRRGRAAGALIAQQWSLATALSLLAWFVFAPQCLSTLATVRRETNSWRVFYSCSRFGVKR
jgi:ferrous iron transport protein B